MNEIDVSGGDSASADREILEEIRDAENQQTSEQRRARRLQKRGGRCFKTAWRKEEKTKTATLTLRVNVVSVCVENESERFGL